MIASRRVDGHAAYQAVAVAASVIPCASSQRSASIAALQPSAGGGDRLPISMVMDVAGDEHAIDLRAGLVVDDEVALLVDLEPVAERGRCSARSRSR